MVVNVVSNNSGSYVPQKTLNSSISGNNVAYSFSDIDTILDDFDERKQKSKDWYAKIISHFTKNKKRPDSATVATVIGGVGGVAQALFLAVLHYKFLKNNKELLNCLEYEKGDGVLIRLQKWYLKSKLNKTNKWTNKFNVVKNIKNPVLKGTIGVGLSVIATALTGAGFGYLWNAYDNYKKTKVNGELSHISNHDMKKHPILAKFKKLSETEQGKKIIKDAIVKNDDGSVTVNFKGANKSYTFTKDDLKAANDKYITKFDSKGSVTGYIKKYARADGDALVLELAFAKLKQEKDIKDIKTKLVGSASNQICYLLSGHGVEDVNFSKTA
jgi:hypothetical protein